MADIQRRIANLSPDKRAILEQRLQDALQAGGSEPTIPRRAGLEPAPLSFSQERLWFLSQLYPGQTTYNEASAYRLTGELDLDALQTALDGIVERHEILRTTYHIRDDSRPAQIVGQPREVPLPIVDLTHVDGDEQVAAAQGRFADVIEVPFDLASDLMFRCCLYRLDRNDHILLTVRHHIASDGWSSRLFWNELAELYTAETVGRAACVPELPVQYADYAAWQREWLQGERLEQQLDYWRQQLSDLPLLQLPTDRKRPDILTHRGAGERFKLKPELVKKLRKLAREEGTTLHTVLLAVYAVLLSRTTSQEDIVIGTPIVGRIRLELEPLIGFFVNTLVIRARLGEELSFRALLQQMRQTMLAALANQDAPFEQLVQELEPERHLNRSPLISTAFQLLDLSQSTFDLPLLTIETVDVPNLHAKFDMECSLVSRPNGLSGHWRYATDLFRPDTIRRMIGRYQMLLAAVVEDPDSTIGQLPMLTEDERQQVLSDWSTAAPTAAPAVGLVHELFEAQVRFTPDAVAVVAAEQQLSYRELNQRANQVARRLQDLGVGPETTVGLYLDRAVEMVIGLLGILKAGGAFVPLDPAVPSARLQMLAEDAGLHVILTTAQHVPGWPETGIPVECLDAEHWATYQASPDPKSAAREGSAAYILYTSGSTGKPKGVVVEQQQLMSYVCAAVAQFGMMEGGVFAMVQPLTVDSCHTMIFPALGWGGELHLINRERSLDAVALSAYFERHRPDFLKIAPSHLQALLTASDPDLLLPQHCLIIGGEVFHWDLAERLLALQPACAIWNHYGPTETTVGVLTYPVCAGTAKHRPITASVPLGRPLPGVQICILDRFGNPAPTGTPGELYVGGPFVARGYLNRPEQTAVQFLEDNLFGEEGGRLYRTGDLVRRLADGVVEFLGRNDNQVKVRGIRIELGEIETVLGDFPGIVEHCVILRDDERDEQEIVAYLSPRRDGHLVVQELDAYMRARLPEVMVPSAYVMLATLPRTTHGKIDRSALPAPDTSARLVRESHIAPRTPEEKAITSIWCEVLGIENVGIYDNFFELGGHSLLATQVVARVSRIFAVEVSVRTLFGKPFVAELAAWVRTQRQGYDAHGEAIQSLDKRDRAPLSFAQQRLWFLNQLEPQSAAYHIPGAYRLRGTLDIPALEQSLRAIVQRHAALRTVFIVEEGVPQQFILQEPDISLPLIDLTHLPPSEREAAALDRVVAQREKAFDLTRDLMIRTQVLRLDAEEHILSLVMHHIASDGWSMGIFRRELAEAYAAIAKGETPSFAPLPVQYADYAVWQREWLQGERLEGQLDYWRQQLTDLPLLQLPTDHRRTDTLAQRGAGERFKLERELVEKLRKLAREEGTTLHTVLLAVYAVLLSRTAAQDDIAIGTPIAGRIRTELEPLIGFFVNTLVIRARLDGNPSFRVLLQQMRQTTLAAYDNQDIPFEKLVEELEPERHLNRNPLTTTLFQLFDLPRAPAELPGLTAGNFSVPGQHTRFDMECSLVATPDGVSGRWHYATELFSSETIQRMIGHFQTLLEAIVEDLDCAVGHLPMLTEAERQQILFEWNAAPVAGAPARLIHEVFEAQAKRTPDAVAINLPASQDEARKETALTYGELNRRANCTARVLRRLGTGPEKLVVLYMERSLEMVIAILAILKAGGAYLPLDPRSPTDRLAFMAEDSKATVILTQQSLVDKASALTSTKLEILCLDRDWSLIKQESDENLPNTGTPDTMAYVIYTSGSTGTPKGVIVTHANVTRLFEATEAWYHFDEQDVWTLFHSVAFDFSVWELWGALFYGGRLVVIPYLVSRSPDVFYEWLCREEVTVLNQTPSAFRQLIRAEEIVGQNPELALRYVIFGGESLEIEGLRAWFDRHGDQAPQLVNMYGITETTAHVTYRPLSISDLDAATGSVIGVPIPDLQVFILDANGQLAPVGVPGEIYVAGAGLSRGYLNQPELTEQRFVAASNVPGLKSASARLRNSRLYRSGDQARWRPNGELEYIGRLDYQIKIRGFRVELGEIESVLSRLPSVRESVVIALQDEQGYKSLAAYYVSEPRHAIPDAAELHTFLSKQCPDYMLPTFYVAMEHLPLTSNGKIDRAALPAPDTSARLVRESHIAPRTPEEKVIASIWCEVLGIENVGVHDNFFGLGGHSLLATQVIARVSRIFAVEVPVRTLFEKPFVAELAAWVRARRLGRDEGYDLHLEEAIQPQDKRDEVPLSFAQQRLWFLNQLEPQSAAYHIPSAYRLNGKLDIPALEQSLHAIVQRHAALRTVFIAQEGVPQQVILQEPDISLPVVDLTHLPQLERETAALERVVIEREKPFDLTRDLMIRAQVLRLGAEEHILSLVMHHIASDGWSMGIFRRELAEAYAAFSSGNTPSFTPLPIQYADYAVWQREWLQGERLEGQLDYWRHQLADLPLLQLPTDRRRPDSLTRRGAGERFILDPGLVEKLRKLAREEGTTLHTVLLAAYAVLLSRTTVQDDVAIGTPIAGRIRTELEPLIGFFVNTLVIRARLDGNPSFRVLLQQMRQTTLAAYDNQDIPFEKLVEELEPERHLNRNPLTTTLFQLFDLPRAPAELPGLTAGNFSVPGQHTRFDMECSLVAAPDGVSGRWHYATELFSSETIQRMIGHFQILLEAIVGDPECAVGHLPMLTEDEWRQLLVKWNDTAVPYPRDSTIHALFEAQAMSTPQATAAFFEGQILTYAELNRRANRLAHFLIEQGVEPGEIVGLALERSLELVVAMLAILKSGAAYLPLDTEYPRERINWMLDDAKCRLIISSNALRDSLPGDRYQLICLDDENEAAVISRQSNDNPGDSGETSSTAVAYVMFTSGSSGRPKGVIVPHRAVVRLVKNTNYADLGPEQRFLQFAPISFDASTLEIWGPLLNGGQLFIYPPGPTSLGELADYLREQQITTLWLTAGLFHQMVEHEVETLAGIAQLLSGGDVLSPQHVLLLLQAGGICRFSNGYGPTENTTFTTCFPLLQADEVQDRLSIGRPINNSTIYILDAYLQPVPIGVPGELYAGGDGLALGYLKRPKLTEAAFIPNPFSSDEQARLYRTGDLVRWLPDGNIEFLGRLDRQVKIRGYRIEPGEVENHLERHEAVKQAVVIVHENEARNKQLIAYIVPVPGQSPQEQVLKRFLSQHLPDYMIPSTAILLSSLPLNANGKVDRQALPVPDGTREGRVGEYVAPRNDIERVLADTWAELLDLDKVGVYDNFFELGGHSLLATQLISRMRTTFDIELQLHVLFEKPTIAEIARHVKIKRDAHDGNRKKIDIALEKVNKLSQEEVDTLLGTKKAVSRLNRKDDKQS